MQIAPCNELVVGLGHHVGQHISLFLAEDLDQLIADMLVFPHRGASTQKECTGV